jgi:hypothetical protein
MIQKKKIVVVSTGSKPNPANPQMKFYWINGNDGISYQTTNYNWFAQRAIGEELEISYEIKSGGRPGGKVYTNYWIVIQTSPTASIPAAGANNMKVMMEALGRLKDLIFARIEESENNIIARIELIGPVAIPEPESIQIGEDEDPNNPLNDVRPEGIDDPDGNPF